MQALVTALQRLGASHLHRRVVLCALLFLIGLASVISASRTLSPWATALRQALEMSLTTWLMTPSASPSSFTSSQSSRPGCSSPPRARQRGRRRCLSLSPADMLRALQRRPPTQVHLLVRTTFSMRRSEGLACCALMTSTTSSQQWRHWLEESPSKVRTSPSSRMAEELAFWQWMLWWASVARWPPSQRIPSRSSMPSCRNIGLTATQLTLSAMLLGGAMLA
mmetsp:Transcript_11642/g.27145  ORF Transcript_11642/g.27145 Transcript_11642/m.27145 type:complete len:222 (-) Transcript_11642:1888-2553(-)